MFVEQGDKSYITPAVTASYRQAMPFGAVTAFYNRDIGTAGGLGGTTVNSTFGGSLDYITLRRGLSLTFAPQYTIVETHGSDRIDVRALILPVSATYRFNEWVAAVASYQFFLQRSDSTFRTESGSTLASDADQNRIFVGLQFGYPFRFDSPFR
jgi:predicted porin